MHINQLSESKYLKKEDCEPPIDVTITDITHENLAREGDPEELKYILNFKECKPMVLNPTNAQLIAMATGSEETDDWKGKKVTLWNDKSVSFGGKIVGGIRVKPEAPAAQKSAEFDDEIPF